MPATSPKITLLVTEITELPEVHCIQFAPKCGNSANCHLQTCYLNDTHSTLSNTQVI